MSASEEIEKAIRRKQAEEQRKEKIRQEDSKRKIADSKRNALGFIELMNRNGIQPDPVYTRTQILRTSRFRGRSRPPIDQFQIVDWGWVIQCRVSELNLLTSIVYLRPDVKIAEADSCKLNYPRNNTQGLENVYPCKAFRAHNFDSIICFDVYDGIFNMRTFDPYFEQGQYVEAARWYLE